MPAHGVNAPISFKARGEELLPFTMIGILGASLSHCWGYLLPSILSRHTSQLLLFNIKHIGWIDKRLFHFRNFSAAALRDERFTYYDSFALMIFLMFREEGRATIPQNNLYYFK